MSWLSEEAWNEREEELRNATFSRQDYYRELYAAELRDVINEGRMAQEEPPYDAQPLDGLWWLGKVAEDAVEGIVWQLLACFTPPINEDDIPF